MTDSEIAVLIDTIRRGDAGADEAAAKIQRAIRSATMDDLDFARVDLDRQRRQGFPEVILGLGKTASQIAAIAERIVGHGQSLLVTRATAEAFHAVQAVVPDAVYHSEARAITFSAQSPHQGVGTILVACAGTSDLPVAEEAVVTARTMGNMVERLYDVGVAGLHRLLREQARLDAARVIIVVAGMEGALPSVVAGLVKVPVIAVPTSIGYGASFGGLAALLGMLNSCANGVAVVNIDNGFGAACMASLINHPA